MTLPPKTTEKDVKFDPRFPDFFGFWNRSIPNRDQGPAVDKYDEPHIKRKIAILKKYPQIKELAGYDIRTKYITFAAVTAHIALAYYFGRIFTGSWYVFALASYCLGASIAALYGVIFHEITHNLAAPTSLENRFIGLVANIPLLIPLAMSFRRYHLEHHTYQGVKGYDPDLPLDWEVKYIGNNPILKFLWLMIYGIMYIVRGLAMNKPLRRWELINWAWSVGTNTALYYLVGGKGIGFLALSVAFGYGPHPGAAHFIQEHYTFANGQETYNYYGSGNLIYMNIGYHNEHHDFHNIPWSNLPKVKAIAMEFYDNMAYHDSWWRVLYLFVTCKLLAPQSRVVRSYEDHTYARKNLRVKDEVRPDGYSKGTNISAVSDAAYDKEYNKLVSV
ncbi:Sphingolipid delta(4)-desaturase DES1 [Smittium culicis]|uniref:Sphingolipid delta(4)-desaturase DES1 n=1 Tax=Smittium culicis TaxID=133412 RepID=A0A1R1Y7V0_9FUNG|nr:Sphingolipid delta(4)-desaturase DES1 [Smittium culicis]